MKQNYCNNNWKGETMLGKAYITLDRKVQLVIYFEHHEVEHYGRMLRRINTIVRYFRPAINFRKKGGRLTWVDRVGDTWNYKHMIEII